MRDIKAEEELCTNYLHEGGFDLPRAERQLQLQRKFRSLPPATLAVRKCHRFQCDCRFCILEGDEAQVVYPQCVILQ